jgi:hypothetical protein
MQKRTVFTSYLPHPVLFLGYETSGLILVSDVSSRMQGTRMIFLSSVILVGVIHLVPEAFGQNNTKVDTNMTAPSGIDWNMLCNNISQMNILLQSCNDLVSQNGTLTSAGETAMGCIKNGLLLGLEALHHGVPLSRAIFGLGVLAHSNGCGGIVNMNAIESANQFQFLTRAMGLQ